MRTVRIDAQPLYPASGRGMGNDAGRAGNAPLRTAYINEVWCEDSSAGPYLKEGDDKKRRVFVIVLLG